MTFDSLSAFLQSLKKNNAVREISVEVDPEYEINEIVQRLYSHWPRQTPALLFNKVKGSKFPLAINLLGAESNVELLLGDTPERIGERLLQFFRGLPQAAGAGQLGSFLWRQRHLLMSARSARLRRVAGGPVKEVKKTGDQVDLGEFPIMKCWPRDGGKFITAGLTLTKSPKTGLRNLGIYRLQMFDKNKMGLHWQIQKGGGFHYAEAEELDRPLPVAIVLGGDPILWLAGILPLPEGFDELAFAGYLRGKPVPMVRCETIDLEVPAFADIVIEGTAYPGKRRMEGPFGDHFGHYSQAAEFPVMEVSCITHRRDAIYPSAVVGKPPQEDKVMGETVSKLFLPMVQLIKPELVDLWAYYQPGFHNLLVASARQRYGKEGIRTALGLLGEGQLSLSKCVVMVDPEVNVRDFSAVLRALRDHFDPEKDFILLPGTSQDTLDFTGPRMNYGSKMILDATASGERGASGGARPPSAKLSFQSRGYGPEQLAELINVDPGVLEYKILEETLLVVKTRSNPRLILTKLLQKKELHTLKLMAVVSDDVPLENETLLLWGLFTRFDCERDLMFADTRVEGARVSHWGPLGIDATWKKGYPEPLEMDPKVAEKVSRRWNEYGFNDN